MELILGFLEVVIGARGMGWGLGVQKRHSDFQYLGSLMKFETCPVYRTSVQWLIDWFSWFLAGMTLAQWVDTSCPCSPRCRLERSVLCLIITDNKVNILNEC